MSSKKLPALVEDKAPSNWPCHCCTCQSVPSDDHDPKCHIHGEGHGVRGCVRHTVTPQRCPQANCGCVPDHNLENARHAEMQARGERYRAQLRLASIEVVTEDTPEELEALQEARRKAAIAQHEAQQKQFNAAVAAAVEVALRSRESQS